MFSAMRVSMSVSHEPVYKPPQDNMVCSTLLHDGDTTNYCDTYYYYYYLCSGTGMAVSAVGHTTL